MGYEARNILTSRMDVFVKDVRELAVRSDKAVQIMHALFDGTSESDGGEKFARDCEAISRMLKELSIGRSHKIPAGRRSIQ